jgi:ParB family transcriptional regulator, chromosome partitioning protein
VSDTVFKASAQSESAVQTRRLAVEDISVGERLRRDLGDIEALAASIEDIGLLNPITVDETGRLLAGARRLAACKLLGWEMVPVNVRMCGR